MAKKKKTIMAWSECTVEKRDLGEFTVQSIEPLGATGAVKITV